MRQLKKKEVKKLYKSYQREQEIVLLLENVQYARNVAGIFRTADAAGVKKIFLSGISHPPPFGKGLVKASRHKEKSVRWEYEENTFVLLEKIKQDGFYIVAIELTDESVGLDELSNKLENESKICFIAGNEVYGVTNKTLAECDLSVAIPMFGKGGSLNVGVSVGVVLYAL